MKIPEDIKRYALKRKLMRIAIWLIFVGIFSFAFFSSWKSISDSVYTEIRVVIFVGVLIVSVFAFGIPKLLFARSFIGRIISFNVVTKADSDMRMGLIESFYRRIWIYAIIELENGKRIRRDIASKSTQGLILPPEFRHNANGSFLANQYCVGDTVIFVSGAKYCQVYSEDKENLTCVACGEFNHFENSKCDNCGHTIMKG